jgi:putative phage-type endonuclease
LIEQNDSAQPSSRLRQGTDEWRQARCGSIGASDAPSVVRRIKSGGYSADRESLMAAKILERVTMKPREIPKTFAMQQGTAREPDARLTYALRRDVEVEETGLVPHPFIKGSHASPDGLVGVNGLVEIKCPLEAAHIDTLIHRTISNDHIIQMQWQMACCPERQWCDFMSYNPDFPARMRMWDQRVPRHPALILELEREIAAFIRELERKVEQLRREYPEAA